MFLNLNRFFQSSVSCATYAEATRLRIVYTANDTDAARTSLGRAPIAVDLYHDDPKREFQIQSLLKDRKGLTAGTEGVVRKRGDGKERQLERSDVRRDQFVRLHGHSRTTEEGFVRFETSR